MSENLNKYKQIFMQAFDIPEEATIGLKYQGISAWDSVGHMGLMTAVEDGFGILMEPDDIIDFSSFEKGLEILSSRYNVKF